MKRILVICNKQWEADPVLFAILEKKVNPAFTAILWQSVSVPLPPTHDWRTPRPRAILRFPTADPNVAAAAYVEIWCIEDWMDPTKSSSSSEEKARILPSMLGWANPDAPQPADYVIAVGTAGFPNPGTYNGSVVIGANAFIFDGHPAGDPKTANRDSGWSSPLIGAAIPPTFAIPNFFVPALMEPWRFQAEARFIRPPMAAAPEPIILCAGIYTAVGVVNVTNYDEYVWADVDALAALKAAQPHLAAGSVETTHGVIRAVSDPIPFLFVSAITDREGAFNMEVGARAYAQNFACAHNAGIALSWFLPYLVGRLP